MKLELILFIISVIVFPVSAFAQPSIILEKTSYKVDDTIKISGKVVFEENFPIVIQVRSPSDIVAIEQFFPSKSGSYSRSFDATGPKWGVSGLYTVIVSYNGEKSEKTFIFSAENMQKDPVPKQDETKPAPVTKPKPKISIANFPDPTLSPNFYIEMYKTDPDFKKLFDTSFPGQQIKDLVGYQATHVPGFPDYDLSPQYYIDRYTNEPRFKVWFDSQFPDNTIYDIVGISEKTRPTIPSWIKQYAMLWSEGKISDTQFGSGISELVQKKIVLVSDDIIKSKNSDENIPVWFKYTAKWYSSGTITEDDFLLGLQYLIEKEIIVI